MEDYILREIDKIGQMLMTVAKRLGLFEQDTPAYALEDVKEELGKAHLSFDLDTILQQEDPLCYLVGELRFSDAALEIFVEILFHSECDETTKSALLEDALVYLDGKGNYSFRLHSLKSW